MIKNEALGKKILSTTDVKDIMGISYKNAQNIIREIRTLNAQFYKKSPIASSKIAGIHLARYIGWDDNFYMNFQKNF